MGGAAAVGVQIHVVQLAEGDRFARRQQMVVAHVESQLAVLHREIRDVGLVVALAAEDHIQRAPMQLLGEVVGESLGHLHDDPLVEGLLEVADEARQIVVLGGEGGAEVHGAERGRRARAHGRHAVVDGAQGEAHVLVEHLAVGGEEHRAAVALEQGSAQLLLQGRNSPREGRLGDEQLLRRSRVVKHLGEFLEVVQLREVHGFPLRQRACVRPDLRLRVSLLIVVYQAWLGS